jgi:hypothetical protein
VRSPAPEFAGDDAACVFGSSGIELGRHSVATSVLLLVQSHSNTAGPSPGQRHESSLRSVFSRAQRMFCDRQLIIRQPVVVPSGRFGPDVSIRRYNVSMRRLLTSPTRNNTIATTNSTWTNAPMV